MERPVVNGGQGWDVRWVANRGHGEGMKKKSGQGVLVEGSFAGLYSLL